MMDWEAQGVRFVLYSPRPGALPDAVEVWKTLLAPREPEMTQRPSGVVPGVPHSIAAGNVRGLSISVNVQPGRLDILVGRPGHSPFSPGDGSAPPVENMLSASLHYGLKAIQAFESLRVAMVLDVLQPAADWNDAAEKFYAALSFVPRCKAVREVNFQLNSLRTFERASGEMNRLCQWQTALFHLLAMQQAGGSPHFVNERHALTFQMDLSSSIGTQTLESANAKAMLEEIGEELRALLEEGFGRLAA